MIPKSNLFSSGNSFENCFIKNAIKTQKIIGLKSKSKKTAQKFVFSISYSGCWCLGWNHNSEKSMSIVSDSLRSIF